MLPLVSISIITLAGFFAASQRSVTRFKMFSSGTSNAGMAGICVCAPHSGMIGSPMATDLRIGRSPRLIASACVSGLSR